tara:strand:- start:15 stop:257 length:243 start_codon:yes stop_codon:yes gene_type:complete
MFNFCLYKDILGKPETGLHRFRIFNIAIFDVLLTFVLAYMLKLYIIPDTHYGVILFGCFLLGIFAHRLFCVKTTIDKFLF